VYSTALNHLRKKRPEVLSLDDEDKPLRLPDQGAPDASRQMESEERRIGIQQAIARLSPDDASIITLFYLYEHSLEEICGVMDLSMTNAKTKLCRARQRLKTILEQHSHEEQELRRG
jgi:RNA polymerase sigma-70 factor (ECF subfamily)